MIQLPRYHGVRILKRLKGVRSRAFRARGTAGATKEPVAEVVVLKMNYAAHDDDESEWMVESIAE